MRKSLAIFVSTFGRHCIYTNCAIPIEVGAYNRENFIYKLHDNNGNNISAENEYYGELTGLYYVWKNMDLSKYDFIGFSHYNKKLKISKKEIIHFLTSNRYGWIVSGQRKIPPHSDMNEWKTFCEVIQEKYPKYYDSLHSIYREDGSSNQCSPANMFITSNEELKKYCEFVFGVCAELRLRIGNNQKPRYHKRYCAFLSERLLSIYVDTEHRRIKEVDIQYPKKLIIARIIAQKMKKYEKTKLYQYVKNKFSVYFSMSSYH